jgi:hypothetical protein
MKLLSMLHRIPRRLERAIRLPNRRSEFRFRSVMRSVRGAAGQQADDFCIGSEVSVIGLFERHGKFFDCGPGVRTEATPPHKRLRRLLDQHTDSVCKPLHAGVPRHPEEWRKTLSI